MPNPVEIATIEANGQIYSNWKTVEVENISNEAPLVRFNFIASEKSGRGASFANIKLKPGDKVTVKLAGIPVVNDGLVMVRNAAFDAGMHQIQISGHDKSGTLIHNDVPLKGNQFKKSTFEQIAKKVLKPHGISLRMKNAGKDSEKKFADIAAIPGESVYDFVDRLARMRNLHLWASGDGTVHAGHMESGSGAELVEGRNILAASCVLNGQQSAGDVIVPGQSRGDDNVSDEDARKPAAKSGTKTLNSENNKRIVVPESAGDADDMRIRADREAAEIAGSMIEAVIFVQGWFKPSGGLWEAMQPVTVDSPSLLLSPSTKLGIQRLSFTQDQHGGTRTALGIVREAALGVIGGTEVMSATVQN